MLSVWIPQPVFTVRFHPLTFHSPPFINTCNYKNKKTLKALTSSSQHTHIHNYALLTHIKNNKTTISPYTFFNLQYYTIFRLTKKWQKSTKKYFFDFFRLFISLLFYLFIPFVFFSFLFPMCDKLLEILHL